MFMSRIRYPLLGQESRADSVEFQNFQNKLNLYLLHICFIFLKRDVNKEKNQKP